MTIHQRTHPTFVEGCGPCRWGSVGFGVAAFPTRKPEAIRHGEWAAQMDKDLPAYKALRDEGIQPKGINGAYDAMMRSETKEQAQGEPELWGRRDEFLTGEVPDMGVKDAPVE